jgi:selenocysteine lyase/cysteine desulfurase
VIADFIGADLSSRTLIFVQNATHALNKLAMRFCMADGSLVLCTLIEHHSNMLPWRKRGCVVEYARVNRQDGTLDMADLEDKVRRNSDRLRLVTVTGASNVTGVMPPIRQSARLAHEHGAMVAVDATQLVPHRPFKMGEPEDPERIDFVAFSAHKMYAPFGSGVLVGPRWVFERGVPDMVGGGTINAVTVDDVIWADPPEREEAGTPNVPGVLALSIAIKTLNSIGVDNLTEHERELTRRLLSRLVSMDGIRLFGPRDPDLHQDRLGVVPFLVDGFSHGELAAILSYEWGIGVRNGCFCAQPYVRELLDISDQQMLEAVSKLAAGDHTSAPGLVRASIAVYNTADEVDYLVEALQSIIRDGPRARYVIDREHHDYVPDPPVFRLERYAPF